MSLHRALSFILLTALSAGAQTKPVIGFLTVDAEQYYAEEREGHPYGTRVLLKNGFEFGLLEWRLLFGEQAEPERTLKALRQFHVCMIDTPFDVSITEIGPAQQRRAETARRALEQYLSEGGSAFICLQAVRYPGDKDQDIWGELRCSQPGCASMKRKPFAIAARHPPTYRA